MGNTAPTSESQLSELDIPEVQPVDVSRHGHSKAATFEWLIASLTPYMEFHSSVSYSLESELHLLERLIVSQKQWTSIELKEQIDMLLGQTAMYCDLVGVAGVAYLQVATAVEQLGKGEEKALLKEFIVKAQSENRHINEVILGRNLKNLGDRMKQVCEELRTTSKNVKDEETSQNLTIALLDKCKFLLDSTLNVLTEFRAHRLSSALFGERPVDESALKVAESSGLIEVMKIGYSSVFEWALLESEASQNAVKGWEEGYVRARELHDITDLDGLLKGINEDLMNRVGPKYTEVSTLLRERSERFPHIRVNSSNVFESETILSSLLTESHNLATFLRVNLDIIHHLLHELDKKKGETSTSLRRFVHETFVLATAPNNPLRTFLSLRVTHLNMIRYAEELKHAGLTLSSKGEINPEERDKILRLKEEVLMLGEQITKLAMHDLFKFVPILTPKRQVQATSTIHLDLSVTDQLQTHQGDISQSFRKSARSRGSFEFPSISILPILLLSCLLFTFNYYIAIIPAYNYAKQLSQGEGYAALYVCTAAVGGLLSVGAHRQWVKTSYYKPLWLSIALMATGNAMLLATLNINSQSFSLLARMLIGAGNPIFLCRYYIRCMQKNKEREDSRKLLVISLIAGAGLGFLFSGGVTTLGGELLGVQMIAVPCILACLLDIGALLAVSIHYSDEKVPSIPAPIIRSEPEQHRLFIAALCGSLPHLVWECLLILAPICMHHFSETPFQAGVVMLLAATIQVPFYYLQDWGRGQSEDRDQDLVQVEETNWVLFAFSGGLALAIAGTAGYTSMETFLILFLSTSPVFILSTSSCYQLLKRDPPFSKKGSWWCADFTMAVTMLTMQLLGGLWAALVLVIDVQFIAFSFFLPALVVFAVGLVCVLLMAERWPLMNNPLS